MWSGLQPGDVLAHRYRIGKCIGKGGMGKVFAAEDLKLSGKMWAVKEYDAGGQGTEMSAREVDILLKLDHPNLPDIVDYFHFPEYHRSYLVMELVKGKTISEWTKEHGKASEEFASQVGINLCDILMYLHGQKPHPLIHRDLKPDNVMVDEHNHVHLIDFGIARTYKDHHQNDTLELGTPASLAPEQRSGRQTDERTDLYQLGGVLYYMLSGGKLYESAHDVLQGLRDLSVAFRQLLCRLLSELPEDRPSTAAEVKAELAALCISERGKLITGQAEGRQVGQQADPDTIGMIVVASLYPGAGATRTAIGLAEAFAQVNKPCSIVEYAKHPEYVYLLGGEESAPAEYTYLIERGDSQHRDVTASEWRHRSTFWYPMPPRADGDSIGLDKWYSALLFLRTPVTILDVGHNLEDEFVKDLLTRADHLVFVIDDRIYKWYRQDIEHRIENIASLTESRDSLHIVAYPNAAGSAHIWRSFPLPIRVKLPQHAGRLTPLELYAPLLRACGVNVTRGTLARRRLLLSR